jgi:hypothetical protein
LKRYGISALEQVKDSFLQEYANLAVATYLLGNTDLHDKNWGLLRDNRTGAITTLAPCFDFDGCFVNYSTSKNLRFLPECQFKLEDGRTVEVLSETDAMELDYEMVGPTIEEAAVKYAPYCTISVPCTDIIPVPYREEFERRLCVVLQERMREAEEDMELESR